MYTKYTPIYGTICHKYWMHGYWCWIITIKFLSIEHINCLLLVHEEWYFLSLLLKCGENQWHYMLPIDGLQTSIFAGSSLVFPLSRTVVIGRAMVLSIAESSCSDKRPPTSNKYWLNGTSRQAYFALVLCLPGAKLLLWATVWTFPLQQRSRW